MCPKPFYNRTNMKCVVFYVFTCLFFFFYNLDHVAGTEYQVSAKNKNQTITIKEADFPIRLKVQDISNGLAGDKDCDGDCHVPLFIPFRVRCRVLGINNSRYLDVSIDEKYNGEWNCHFPVITRENQTQEVNLTMKMTVQETTTTTTPTTTPTTKATHTTTAHITTTKQIKKTSSSEAKYITLVEGVNELKLNLSEIHDIQVGNCEGGCIVHDIQISTLSCQTKDGDQQQMYVHVKLQKNIVKSEHSGEWICTFDLPHVVDGRRETIPYEQRFFAIVSSEAAKQKDPLEPWMIVAIAVGGSVIIIIILGQTGCILYFKAKAKRAEIAKNLTPNKNSEDLDSSARERYVNKEKELSDSHADEIYESLEAVRVPIPPSIETIPVTPKPRNPKPPNKPCPASHNDFGPRSDPGHANTEPRPQPKDPMASRGLNSASSLDRIQKRPRQPLPTEEIYEEMITGASPELMKSSGPSFGGRRPRELPQTPRPPYSPGVVQKQPIGPPGQRMPTPGLGQHGMVQSGHPMPGHVRPPIRQPQMPGPGRPLPGFMGPMGPTGPMRPMGPISPPGPRGPMPILPSMISGAVLKPVPMNKQGPRTPVGLRRMVHEPSVLSITPAQSISNLARRPLPVPQLKPKPPVPLPVQHKLQPEEPSQEPGLYYGSSDEEFEAYEPLPEYRIYGNAPPKKFTRNE